MKKIRMFENFGEADNENRVVFPWDEDYGYMDLNDQDDFEEHKDNIHFKLKTLSEDVLNVIGFENETKWFQLLNAIVGSLSNDELQDHLFSLKEFLEDFESDQIEEINIILNTK